MLVLTRIKKVNIFIIYPFVHFVTFQLCMCTVRSPNYNSFQSQRKLKISGIVIVLRNILLKKKNWKLCCDL